MSQHDAPDPMTLLPLIQRKAKEIYARVRRNDGMVAVGMDDLIQEGLYGATLAASRYDRASATKFFTYAYHRAVGRMRDYVRANRPGRSSKAQPARMFLASDTAIVGNEGSVITAIDSVPCCRECAAGLALRRSEAWAESLPARSALKPRQRLIVAILYREGMTPAEAAAALNLTEGGVSYLVTEAMDAMRMPQPRVEGRPHGRSRRRSKRWRVVLGPATIARVVAAAAAGVTCREIADELGVSVRWCKVLLRENGVRLKDARLLGVERQVAERHGQGFTDQQTAAALGVSVQQVRDARKRLGLPSLAPAGGPPLSARTLAVLKGHAAGETAAEIASRLGLEVKEVRRILKRHKGRARS